MFRYRLRTLLIVLALGPPMIAGVWWVFGVARFIGVTLGLGEVWWVLGAVLYLAVWVAVVIAWRWAHRPAMP